MIVNTASNLVVDEEDVVATRNRLFKRKLESGSGFKTKRKWGP